MRDTTGGGSLAKTVQERSDLVVASPYKQPEPRGSRSAGRQRLAGSFSLIEGALSARRVVRQAPWLAGLHRFADGALIGLGVSMLGLSALTLHWQNQWGSNFRGLETTQILERRMQESAAVLEQHHLGAVRKPGLLVPTSSEQLVHLPPPPPGSASSPRLQLDALRWFQSAAGY